MKTTEINKILKFIEENIRITDQTSIEYLDPKGHLDRLDSKQNQVIFGRRGSGKSLLLKSLKEGKANIICLSVNLEDFKDISFPNSIIQVLKASIDQLKTKVEEDISIFHLKKWFKGKMASRDLNKLIKSLEKRLTEPDNFDEAIKTKSGNKLNSKAKTSFGKNSGTVSNEVVEEIEISKSFHVDKLNILKNQLPELKKLINHISKLLDKPIYLILDDFYFIRRKDQPYFIDFFHRLSKNTNLYLKIATIKHRSSLYLQGETYIGIEITHDAQSLNLDYSLETYDALVNFMRDLLNHVKTKVGVEINFDKVLTENAFRFLCLASGGVPRDFFSLFIKLGNNLIDGKNSITKPNVIEIAIENLPNKLEAFKTDSAEEKEILEHYLQFIREEIIDIKKTNSFLVSNSEVLKYPQINQALKELVDLRLLHFINSNMSSAPSDGLRYSAYMVDVGLFPNSNPRNFKQIEPGQKDEDGREDKIRSAPKINLERYNSFIDELQLKRELTVTD